MTTPMKQGRGSYRRLTDAQLWSRRRKEGRGYHCDKRFFVGPHCKNRESWLMLVADDNEEESEADDDSGDTMAWKILTPGRIYLHHVHALATLISTFHYSKNISAIDQGTFAEYTARTAFLFFVIGLLVGYILYGAATHIVQVEDDFHEVQELKGRAEAAEAATSQFLANVSHEMRTPRKGILGMLALLLDTELSSTQRDYAQTAQACGKALIALIKEVLDRAKIEAGKLKLEAVPFDLRLILDDVLSLFSERSRHKGVELAVFVSDKVPEIFMGDSGRFRQVITNLGGNSVTFTEQGHIFVKVQLAEHSMTSMRIKSDTHLNGNLDDGALYNKHQFETLSGCEAVDNQNSWDSFKHLIANEKFRPNASSNLTATNESSDIVTVMISVEDTGIGIPLCAQGQVFMPFMQADSSTARNYGGTGIGLSISKCLVELMGGQINFVSRPQVGSTFSFTAAFRKYEKKATVDIKKKKKKKSLIWRNSLLPLEDWKS